MGTILLVDNNPLRASIRTSILEDVAPEVVRAFDAAEALCLVESPEFAHRLGLVITEHAIPGISGPEFVSELRVRLPHVHVLVLGTVPAATGEYEGITGVSHAEASTEDKLRNIANRLIGVAQ
jgi:CheY-like chemotaxis protein